MRRVAAWAWVPLLVLVWVLVLGCASAPVPAHPGGDVTQPEDGAARPLQSEDGPPIADSGEVEPWLPEDAADEQEQEPMASNANSSASTTALKRASLPEPSGAAKGSAIGPGSYRCKVSREYKLRPCEVTRDRHGRVVLEIDNGLIGMRGVLSNKGARVHFEGILTEDRPFGCFSCQERCSTEPDSCACKEHPVEASQECLLQPVRFDFARQKGSSKWVAHLSYKLYYNEYESGQVVGFTREQEKFVVVLTR